jgi:DNA replication protein DnaC
MAINMTELFRQAQQQNNTALTFDELQQQECDQYNAVPGKLTGFDCSECNNRGNNAVVIDGYVMLKECRCMPRRRSLERIERSGLSKQLEKCSFDKYQATEPWQKHIKDRATAFVKDCIGNWFFIGGQVGSGKSHICTAIVGELLKQGHEAKYMLWRDEIVPLKAKVMDEDYAFEMRKYKKVKVLYIDDFFKTESGKLPTTAEINIAFEILNFRYNNPDLITIISSEKGMSELLDIDEATGSRIFERSKDYSISIARDKNKNYRLKE